MTTREFSNGFDTLLNSYANQGPFGTDASKTNLAFDEYEKSQFLTDAQEQLVLSYYNGKNSYLESFEKTEEMRRYLEGLISTTRLYSIDYGGELLNPFSKVFQLPNDLWFITYEAVTLENLSNECIDGKEANVVPVTQDEYYRTVNNPFKGSNIRRALRLDIGGNKVEIVSKNEVASYLVRYIKKLTPIVLTDLPDGLSIRGVNTETQCALHDSLHRPILEQAVMLALRSKGINLDNNKQ